MEKIKGEVKIIKNIKDIIFSVTDIMLFFFSVNPTVSSSYKLSKTMVVVNDYLKTVSVIIVVFL